MSEKTRKAEERAAEPASVELLKVAEALSLDTCYTRHDAQGVQCKFGTSGVCCRICHMGPCRITAKSPRGVCGADADTIVARNYLREVAGGTAAHSDHGRHLVLRLKKVAEGKGNGYAIKDEGALREAARLYRVPEAGRPANEVALELAELFLREFSSQEESLRSLELAPVKRQNLWESMELAPKGIDRMVVEAMHRSTMGVDHDYRSIVMHAFRTALSDGWGGSRVASICSDILFGTPGPVLGEANLGVLGENTVNIVVHGHEPELSELLVAASRDPELVAYAKGKGAEGITLAGICCTANEILIRHGIPVAGSFLQQELAVLTGAVEALVIDVQCCMPSLPEIAAAYHTKIVSTSAIARTLGADSLDIDEDDPLSSVKGLVKSAIDNYARRDRSKLRIPSRKSRLVAGFSVPAIKYMLGGRYRASFRPLNDAVIQGRIKGIVGIVGCNNPKKKVAEYMNVLARELVRENVIILETGCAAIAAAQDGMLTPEAALAEAGQGLREVCEAVGIPPVLHMGSCVDNSRILEAAAEVVAEGGLGHDLSQVPAVGVAPEWMSEKAVAIGSYFVASGVDVVLGHPFYIEGSEKVTKLLNEEAASLFGGCFHVEEDPLEAAKLILALLDEKRDRLGINKKAERKLFDMKDRRAAHV